MVEEGGSGGYSRVKGRKRHYVDPLPVLGTGIFFYGLWYSSPLVRKEGTQDFPETT